MPPAMQILLWGVVRRWEGRCEGKRETDIFRMRSHSENADNVPAWTCRREQLSGDEFWLVEVVNCTMVADLGPLAGAHSGSSLKIDNSQRWGLGCACEPGLSRPEQRRRGIT